MPARERGDGDPVTVGHLTLDEAERRAVGQQHVGRTVGDPERGPQLRGPDRAGHREPGEQIELGDGRDEQVGGVDPVPDAVQLGRIRDVAADGHPGTVSDPP